jgi:lincosamide nucleotidyltransferase
VARVLVQQRLIARVEQLCRADERLVAALTYGSFVQGEGDAHSDIEFWLFVDPPVEATLDKRAWLDDIGTVRHAVVNEFGAHVVFFPDLVRGEFHFATADDIASVSAVPARCAGPSTPCPHSPRCRSPPRRSTASAAASRTG